MKAKIDPPMNESTATWAANALSSLSYYPADESARSLIADALMEMCQTVGQAKWLVRRAVTLHTKWETCGISGLWQIRFSKYPPRNSTERTKDLQCGRSERYPNGVPSEREAEIRQLEEVPRKRITAAEATGDAQMRCGLTDLMQRKRMS